MSTFANGIGGKLVWGNGLLYLEERGWTELIDPRWTLDVYEELQLSGLGLSDEEMREVIDVICHPEPN